ncbi:MAG: DNA/RNA non-specific endonuclease [Bacteriovorax sp.]
MRATKRLLLSAVWISFLCLPNFAAAKIEVVLGNIPLDQNPNLATNIPVSLESEIVLSRDQYILSYNKYKRVPNWVAWKLEPDQMGNSGRTNKFKADLDLEDYLVKNSLSEHAVTQTEYKGSCYDRGHQVPSADRTDTRENNESTFLMSNMIPQTPYLNRVLWAHFEKYSRDLVKKQGKKIYVIAGPIFDQDFGAIGPDQNIKVPSKEFKILFIFDANETLENIVAVIMPNTLKDGSNPKHNRTALCSPLTTAPENKDDWLKYKTTVLEIEKLSGLQIIK